MTKRRKWTIRKTLPTTTGSCSAYLIERQYPEGRSIAANYRFGKVARKEAKSFRSPVEAQKVIRSLRRVDGSGRYALISM